MTAGAKTNKKAFSPNGPPMRVMARSYHEDGVMGEYLWEKLKKKKRFTSGGISEHNAIDSTDSSSRKQHIQLFSLLREAVAVTALFQSWLC